MRHFRMRMAIRLRLVVPGFYGTNSVKWLTRLTLADRRADSPFTTRWYNDPDHGAQTVIRNRKVAAGLVGRTGIRNRCAGAGHRTRHRGP